MADYIIGPLYVLYAFEKREKVQKTVIEARILDEMDGYEIAILYVTAKGLQKVSLQFKEKGASGNGDNQRCGKAGWSIDRNRI